MDKQEISNRTIILRRDNPEIAREVDDRDKKHHSKEQEVTERKLKIRVSRNQ